MEELFNTHLPGGQKPDIELCIFPHLKEFLAIDLRGGAPQVLLLRTDDIFVEDFYKTVEAEFSLEVRDETDFPFAHFINLPLRLEEVIRETAMTFILEKLGVYLDGEMEIPTVVVFVVSGGALATQSKSVIDGLRELVNNQSGEPIEEQWESTITRLVEEENQVLQKLSRHELHAAMTSDSPDYFTLWENRN